MTPVHVPNSSCDSLLPKDVHQHLFWNSSESSWVNPRLGEDPCRMQLRGQYVHSSLSVTHEGRWKQGQAVCRKQRLPSTGLDFLLEPFRGCAPGEQMCPLWKEMRFPANLLDYSNCVDNSKTTMGTPHSFWLKIQPTPRFLRHALFCQRFLSLHSRGSQFWPHMRNTWGSFKTTNTQASPDSN